MVNTMSKSRILKQVQTEVFLLVVTNAHRRNRGTSLKVLYVFIKNTKRHLKGSPFYIPDIFILTYVVE